MKVITKDFQILSGINTFEFNKGINLIIGSNASGKSSLFYAIENCLTNPNGVSDCINYDAHETQVTIENNEQSVTWTRTLDSCSYKNNITGKNFVKASKLDCRDIADLGFYYDKKDNVVNIHNEWSILFPFGESDSDMFRLFEDIFNISCSFLIIDEMKKDEQSVKSNMTQTQNLKADLQCRCDKLNAIKDNVNEQDINFYTDLVTNTLQQASKLREDYNNYSRSALLSNVILPEVFDVSKLYETYHTYQDLDNDYNNYQHYKEKSCLSIPKVHIDIDFEPPHELRDIYNRYHTNMTCVQNSELQLQQLDQQKNTILENISKIKVCPTCGRPLEE